MLEERKAHHDFFEKGIKYENENRRSKRFKMAIRK